MPSRGCGSRRSAPRCSKARRTPMPRIRARLGSSAAKRSARLPSRRAVAASTPPDSERSHCWTSYGLGIRGSRHRERDARNSSAAAVPKQRTRSRCTDPARPPATAQSSWRRSHRERSAPLQPSCAHALAAPKRSPAIGPPTRPRSAAGRAGDDRLRTASIDRAATRRPAAGVPPLRVFAYDPALDGRSTCSASTSAVVEVPWENARARARPGNISKWWMSIPPAIAATRRSISNDPHLLTPRSGSHRPKPTRSSISRWSMRSR